MQMLNETCSAPAFPPPHTFNSQGQDPGGKERTACHTKPAGNRDGNLVKRVTSTDDGTIEDPENPSGGTPSGGTPSGGSDSGSGGGGDSGGDQGGSGSDDGPSFT